MEMQGKKVLKSSRV